MLIRKLLSAYIASGIVILYVASGMFGSETLNAYSAEHFAGSVAVVALYALPAIFIYGVGVSVLCDLLLNKLKVAGPANWIVAGGLHIAMGFAFGLIFHSSMFSLFGGMAAALYYAAERLLMLIADRRRKAFYISLTLAPVIVFGSIFGYLTAVSPPLPPYTAADALDFATSGKGSVTDLFPKEIGRMNTVVEGYEVERETAVNVIAAELGKERYEVAFIERWTKDGQSGENQLRYTVTRGSMTASGGGGGELPYRR